MFETLSSRLGGVLKGLRNRGRLTEQDVTQVLAEVRTALLEADVNVTVVRDVVERIRTQAVGATSRNIDLVLADTAGRLQNNTNLMEELAKVRRVADKASGKVTEVLLVIDATTGQNGLTQAKQFSLATQVTGVVLTKLDGSAQGGIVFALETELGIPIKLVGLGETIDDLVAFDAAEFVSALFN